MKLISRGILVLLLVIGLGACGGGGGGGGGGGADIGAQGFEGGLLTADLSGAARAQPNATMGALEAN